MKIRKKRKKKTKLSQFPMLIAGLLLILFGFVFAIRSLASPSNHLNSFSVLSQDTKVTHEQFIERLVPHAKELQEGYGVLPSIILAQAILESNWGESRLASEYNNLFGIKAFGHKKSVKLETQEYVNEQWITIKGDFRVYDSWEESMDAHTKLFVYGVDWNPDKYLGVLTASNYKEAANALQEAGYATDPTYAEKLISIIETYQLAQYD